MMSLSVLSNKRATKVIKNNRSTVEGIERSSTQLTKLKIISFDKDTNFLRFVSTLKSIFLPKQPSVIEIYI
jgi:glutamate formiminotransferase